MKQSIDLSQVRFHTSSYSNEENCVEVGVFRPAVACGTSTCVEVAGAEGGGVLVRDSKDTDGPVLQFTPAEWDAFLSGARDGEFDL